MEQLTFWGIPSFQIVCLMRTRVAEGETSSAAEFQTLIRPASTS